LTSAGFSNTGLVYLNLEDSATLEAFAEGPVGIVIQVHVPPAFGARFKVKHISALHDYLLVLIKLSLW
jgi:hypothetical protein